MNSWLLANLACPRDHAPLRLQADQLVCVKGHTYPCIDGIPVLLVAEAPPTVGEFRDTVELAFGARPRPEAGTAPPLPPPDTVDPYVQQAIAGTCGNMYLPLIHKLRRYPIPDFPLPPGHGAHLLDVGCNWGRWCLSADRAGYQPVGIDPSLEAIRTARRVAHQLGSPAQYVVADARYLPFAPGCFDAVFSYSVIQHFAKQDARRCLAEMGRVLRANGSCLVQMANTFGGHNMYNQVRHGFRRPIEFDVRYWSPSELTQAFSRLIGPARLSVDSFFSLNAQLTDLDLLPRRYRIAVIASKLMARVSGVVPGLHLLGDSLYVTARRRAG